MKPTPQRPKPTGLLRWQRFQRVQRNRRLESLRLRLAGLPTDNQHHAPRRAP